MDLHPMKLSLRMKLSCLCFVCFILVGCQSTPQRGWYVLRWMEKPSAKGPSTRVGSNDLRTRFDQVDRFTEGEGDFAQVRRRLQEGDLVAYRMGKIESALSVSKGHLNSLGYQILDYGHLAIVVQENGSSGGLALFSSQSFVGANTKEGVDTLEYHSFDVYRLDQWDQVSKSRFYEFVQLAKKKTGKWYGYDFSGMFGLWNSNLKPDDPKSIGHDYICSTVVLASLYYAGIELDAAQRGGILDLVTPKQVVASRGRIIEVPDAEIKREWHKE